MEPAETAVLSGVATMRRGVKPRAQPERKREERKMKEGANRSTDTHVYVMIILRGNIPSLVVIHKCEGGREGAREKPTTEYPPVRHRATTKARVRIFAFLFLVIPLSYDSSASQVTASPAELVLGSRPFLLPPFSSFILQEEEHKQTTTKQQT